MAKRFPTVNFIMMSVPLVPPYKKLRMSFLREEAFPKNAARKIKRAGLAATVMEEYLSRL